MGEKMIALCALLGLVLLLGFSGIQSNVLVNRETQVAVDVLMVNHADNTVELLELVRKVSLELVRLANEQGKMNSLKEELLTTKEELHQTRNELLTSNAELLKMQNKLTSSQSEIRSRIKDLEVAAEHSKSKDRMRRSTYASVGFTARLTNDLTSGLNSHQTLVFDNVYVNVGNGYDATSGIFHAPVAGMYVILVTISSVGGFGGVDIQVVHNGVPVCNAAATHLYWGGCPCNAVVHLRVGDAVWARERFHHPEDQIRGDYFTTFSMGLMLKDDDGGSSS